MNFYGDNVIIANTFNWNNVFVIEVASIFGQALLSFWYYVFSHMNRGAIFPKIFLKKMRVYKVKKANDKLMAPFGRLAACGAMSSSPVFTETPSELST